MDGLGAGVTGWVLCGADSEAGITGQEVYWGVLLEQTGVKEKKGKRDWAEGFLGVSWNPHKQGPDPLKMFSNVGTSRARRDRRTTALRIPVFSSPNGGHRTEGGGWGRWGRVHVGHRITQSAYSQHLAPHLGYPQQTLSLVPHIHFGVTGVGEHLHLLL